MCRVCWEPPSYIPADARGTFDNHGQKNDAVSLQPIHTPHLLIYINNDLIFNIAGITLTPTAVAAADAVLSKWWYLLAVVHGALL